MTETPETIEVEFGNDKAILGMSKETVIARGKGKPDYNEAIQVITKIITDRKINKADRIYDYMTKGDKD